MTGSEVWKRVKKALENGNFLFEIEKIMEELYIEENGHPAPQLVKPWEHIIEPPPTINPFTYQIGADSSESLVMQSSRPARWKREPGLSPVLSSGG